LGPDDDEYIGYVLSDVARLIRTVFDRRVRDIGLTRAQSAGPHASRIAGRGPARPNSPTLLEIDRASAGRMIDRMQKNGWVERRADSDDRRINRLYLTADARRAHKDMWAIAETTVDDALAPLSDTEREQFTRLAARVKGQLQSMAGAHGT